MDRQPGTDKERHCEQQGAGINGGVAMVSARAYRKVNNKTYALALQLHCNKVILDDYQMYK
ncbi:hypothetical protein EIM92_23050 [Paenibacillus lentus]|uniref:Uncharacterized protein n=1 Tax=Paenibacillus lentus TaxID=1338368 RepID=A0A3Q8S6Z3_9BACL|nr:hypothetical protein EIM92_23050 [Paenibacillus lentus]